MRKFSPYHDLKASIESQDSAKAVSVFDKFGSTIDFNRLDGEGDTVLMSAIKHGMLDLAKKIIDTGKADLKLLDGGGHNYADIAKQYGDQELESAVMKAGAFVEHSADSSDANVVHSSVVLSDDEYSYGDALVSHITTDHE